MYVGFALAIVLVVVLVVVVRTRRCRPAPAAPSTAYRESGDLAGAEKLAKAIRIPTVSIPSSGLTDGDVFLRFHAYLEEAFPLVHQHCERSVINRFSLLYRYVSPVPHEGKLPVLITAHMDVVPVEPGTESDWTHPPYSGRVENGMVWGRGTLDTKIHLIAAMEALERLLAMGTPPACDVYFAFGHDEEINGEEGALPIARHMESLGLRFAFVLDEGGCIVTHAIDGVQNPVALVGVGEKGFANIRLSVTLDGGHASMPARHTSLGVLAEAICRLETHPFRPRLIPLTRGFLQKLAPHMSVGYRMILSNLWLWKPLFIRVFARTQTGGALLRTTLAATMAQGSPAPNVVPQTSTACINCRILPGEDGNTLLSHLRGCLKGLPVILEPLALDNPSAISPCDGEAYRLLEQLITEHCDGVIVAPYLVMGGTDSRKYENVCRHIYRFSPYAIDHDDLVKIHGTNEAISVVNVNRCIDFFTALLLRL